MVIVNSRPMVPKVFCLLAKESACLDVSRHTDQSNLGHASSSGITDVRKIGNDLLFLFFGEHPCNNGEVTEKCAYFGLK